MRRLGRMTAAALLVLALGACTGEAPEHAPPAGTADAPAAAAVPTLKAAAGVAVDLETGTDVGNGRPASSHDGLMVRRQTVIAVHPAQGADIRALRARLEKAAAAAGMGLSDISPMVLDAAVLDHLVPELIAALPPGRTVAEGERLATRAFGKEGTFAAVEHVHVASVLVHDLTFRITAADPAALAAAIAAEGILSDALGSYKESFDAGALTIGYTGPLLSDALVDTVRAGMARGAGSRPAAVQLLPRSATGTGVDLAKEPAPVQADTGAEDADHHAAGDDGSGRDTPGEDDSEH